MLIIANSNNKNMRENEVLYEPRDLRENYEILKNIKNFILIPLFDRVANKFFDDLNHNSLKYGISSGEIVKKQGGGLLDNLDKSYNLVIDGKIITMTMQDEDITIDDADEMWYMIGGISFRGEEDLRNKMLNYVKTFVKGQKLEELIQEAKTELKKGKTYHLDDETRRFYSV